MKPAKSILDRSFRYTNSAETNLRRTFMRVRLEQMRAQLREQAPPPPDNVQPLRKAEP